MPMCQNELAFFLFIHSFYFYSASLVFKSATTQRHSRHSTDTVSEFQATASEGLAQGPYMVARVGFKPTTRWTKGEESTNELPCPQHPFCHSIILCSILFEWFHLRSGDSFTASSFNWLQRGSCEERLTARFLSSILLNNTSTRCRCSPPSHLRNTLALLWTFPNMVAKSGKRDCVHFCNCLFT